MDDNNADVNDDVSLLLTW